MGGPASDEFEEIEWTPYADVVLLNALVGLRPVGINYQFCMVAVWSRFARAMSKNVSLECVKKRLGNFYDFEAANGIVDEKLFDNHQTEFSLPASDFPEVATLLKEKEDPPPLTRNALKNATIASVEITKTPTSKPVKKPEPRTVEKSRRSVPEDDKKTPAKKRRASERTTPAPKRSRI